MTAKALKNSIIEKISHIDDEEFLHAIKVLLEHHSKEEIYKLNDEERESIAISKEQIKNGQFHTQEQVDKEVSKWRNK